MATKLFCDCGCEKGLAGYDAGAEPLRVKSINDIEIEITVLPKRGGGKRNLRPSCVRDIIARGEILCPPGERKVVLMRALGSAAQEVTAAARSTAGSVATAERAPVSGA